MSAGHTCKYCADQETAGEGAPVTEPAPATVELPTVPRRFFVHFADGHVQDCTLHPDGTLTAAMVGQTWRSGLSYEEMHAFGGWAGTRIEWDPAGEPPGPEHAVPVLAPPPAAQTALFAAGGA